MNISSPGPKLRACATSLLPLLLLTLPAAVQAQFNYTTNNGAITITGYTGPGGAVVIPDTINGLPVTSIGDYAFSIPIQTNLTSVTIPNSVTSIGFAAFFQCINLTSVIIPNSVTNIEWGAFGRCTSLRAIPVDALNSFYSSVDGVLFNKSQTLLIQYPLGKDERSYTIPGSVTNTGRDAFRFCTSLSSVTIPDSVRRIEGWAFSDCSSLASVTLGNGVTSIEESAFDSCISLSSVTIPSSVTLIGGYAFNGCTSLSSVTLGNGVTNIEENAFCDCTYLSSVTIPNSVTHIGSSAFCNCKSLSSVTIPDSVTRIPARAFLACTSLASVTIPNSVTNIGLLAFRSCTSLTNITIGNGLANIDDNAFWDCGSLKGVYFQGNAPSVWGYPLYGAHSAIVYYLPGTTGWGTTFSGRPTVLWNALIATPYAGFGVRTNQFEFTITGTSNLVLVVEACTNLAPAIWSPLATRTLTDVPSHFSDPEWTNHPVRFYRLRSP